MRNTGLRWSERECPGPQPRRRVRGTASLPGEDRTMRDPELVARAQQAAVRLESAWDRWRTLHGLAEVPVQPVASYVGYSLKEPWGQPRVVIGVDAYEAEYLAAFLESHQCGQPGQITYPLGQPAVASVAEPG